MTNENIDTKRKKFEEWREHQPWYFISKDDDDKCAHRLMNIAAHSAWDAALASQQVAEPVAVPEGVINTAKVLQGNNYAGPLAWAKKVIDFVADYTPTTPPLVQQSFWQVSIDENCAPRRLKLKIGNQTFHIDAQDEQDELSRVDWYENQLVAAMQRLTTATPQRVALTDEQIGEVADSLCMDSPYGNTNRRFVRAIEAAHGIGALGAQEVAK